MFGRRKKHADDDATLVDDESADFSSEDVDDDDPAHGDDAAAAAEIVPGLSPRPNGPWDSTEVEFDGTMLDLGSLRLRPAEGMELRVDIEEASGQVVSVTCATEDSAMSVQAFAAPRTEGIWDDVRRDLKRQISSSNGLVDDLEGSWGAEIRTQVPAQLPNGTQGTQPARFVGIDGPRWFLRLVFLGAAASDRAAAQSLEDVAREIVVVRDAEARAPGDPLPLSLPESAAPVGDESDGDPAWKRDDVSPFERGPEITEIR